MKKYPLPIETVYELSGREYQKKIAEETKKIRGICPQCVKVVKEVEEMECFHCEKTLLKSVCCNEGIFNCRCPSAMSDCGDCKNCGFFTIPKYFFEHNEHKTITRKQVKVQQKQKEESDDGKKNSNSESIEISEEEFEEELEL